MGEQVRFGRWTLAAEPEKTRAAYGRVQGAPERCGCNICKNFIQARESAYPSDLRQLLDELGIDYRLESELWHSHRVALGRHLYGGAFHFVGAIQDGHEAAVRQENGLYILELASVSAALKIGFSTRITRTPREAFSGLRLVQVDFSVDAPWLLPIDPEPSLTSHVRRSLVTPRPLAADDANAMVGSSDLQESARIFLRGLEVHFRNAPRASVWTVFTRS